MVVLEGVAEEHFRIPPKIIFFNYPIENYIYGADICVRVKKLVYGHLIIY